VGKQVLEHFIPGYRLVGFFHSLSGQKDPVVQVKFFYPDFDWTWYAIEFDGEDTFYGLVDGLEKEFGSFRLSELMENRGKLGLEIERDLSFEPTPVSRLLRR